MKLLRVIAITAIVMGMGLAARAGDEEPSAKLNFVVIKDYNGKPIRNASVVLHPVNKRGKQERGGYELKTDNDGKTEFEGVPYGMLRVQVLAQGFQTFGQDYDIQKPAIEITIKLSRPVHQYSIYGDSSNTPNDSSNTPKKDAPPDQKPQ